SGVSVGGRLGVGVPVAVGVAVNATGVAVASAEQLFRALFTALSSSSTGTLPPAKAGHESMRALPRATSTSATNSSTVTSPLWSQSPTQASDVSVRSWPAARMPL